MTRIIDKLLNETLFFNISEPILAVEKIKEVCAKHGELKEKETKTLSDGPVLKTISEFSVSNVLDRFSRINFFFVVEGRKNNVENKRELSINIKGEYVLVSGTKKGFFSRVFQDFYMREIASKRNPDKIVNEEARRIIKEIEDKLKNNT